MSFLINQNTRNSLRKKDPPELFGDHNGYIIRNAPDYPKTLYILISSSSLYKYGKIETLLEFFQILNYSKIVYRTFLNPKFKNPETVIKTIDSTAEIFSRVIWHLNNIKLTKTLEYSQDNYNEFVKEFNLKSESKK